MKSWLFLFFLISGFLISLGAQALPVLPVESIQNLLPLRDKLSEKKVLLQPNKYIFVDFWASWCEPCKESLPLYSELQKKYPGKIQVIAISLDSTPETAWKFYETHKALKIEFYWDQNKEMQKLFKLQAVPTIFVYDKNKKLIRSVRGFHAGHEKTLLKDLKLK